MASPANPLMGGAGPGANPMAGVLLQALSARQNAPGGGGPGGGPGQEYAQQASELHGADPQMLLRQMQKMNELMGILFIQTFQRLPNVANQISAAMKLWARAIKEGQQAASTAAVVRNPVNFSAAQPSAGPEAGAPQPGAGM
jgi:hypothetical protein